MSTSLNTLSSKISENGTQIASVSSSALNNEVVTIDGSITNYSYLCVQLTCQGWTNTLVFSTSYALTNSMKFGYNNTGSCRVDYSQNQVKFSSPTFPSGVTSALIRIFGIRR
jgi:hypothetical protein